MTAVDCTGLRLLIVGPYPPPFGGVASHLTMLIPGLKDRGAADVAVVSFGSGDDVELIDGATLYRFNAGSRAWAAMVPRNWGIVAATFKALAGTTFSLRQRFAECVRAALVNTVAERHDSKVVSFYQSDLSQTLLPCSRYWHGNRATVLTVFGECYDNPDFFAGNSDFLSEYFSSPKAIVSSSIHCASSFSKFGIHQKIEAVYYGIDLDRFADSSPGVAFRRELGVDQTGVLITYMGRFSKEMGLGRVLDVGDTLLKRFPNVKLLLAGAKGPLGDQAERFRAAHPGQVCVLNDVPFSQQPAIYAASDIVLAPSSDQHACMGMSIKEAMAASRPVVGSDAGGIPEAIVHGETGLLVALDESLEIDPSGLLAAVEQLIADPSLRVRLGAAARKRAEDIFAMDLTVDRMAEIFNAAGE